MFVIHFKLTVVMCSQSKTRVRLQYRSKVKVLECSVMAFTILVSHGKCCMCMTVHVLLCLHNN